MIVYSHSINRQEVLLFYKLHADAVKGEQARSDQRKLSNNKSFKPPIHYSLSEKQFCEVTVIIEMSIGSSWKFQIQVICSHKARTSVE